MNAIIHVDDSAIQQDELRKKYLPWQLKVFASRALHTLELIEAFLAVGYDTLADPFSMEGMQSGVERFIDALREERSIAIYADYDADGVSAATVITDFLTAVGYKKYKVFFPDRAQDGYGVSTRVCQTITDWSKDALVITVDVGVRSHDGIACLRKNGHVIIVTDHHEMGETLPDAHAVVHPKLGNYADPMICGAGVAYQFVRALIITLRKMNSELVKDLPDGFEKWSLDVVAVATIADMVPLVKENRTLVHFGIKVLNKTKRPGLRALFALKRIRLGEVTEDDIGFSIAPTLNAASRMGDAIGAYHLLTATTERDAKIYAARMDAKNDERKQLTAQITKEAKKDLDKRELGDVILIGNHAWHSGVIGLVASALVDRYHKTTCVWTTEGDTIRASCRAYDGESVLDILSMIPEGVLDQYGGHHGAGGFSTSASKIGDLVEAFQNLSLKDKKAHEETHQVCDSIEEFDLIPSIIEFLDPLRPFGMENEKPIFAFANALIKDIKWFGKTKTHLEIIASDQSGKTFRAVSFYAPYEKDSLKAGQTMVIVGTIEKDTYNGGGHFVRIDDIIT